MDQSPKASVGRRVSGTAYALGDLVIDLVMFADVVFCLVVGATIVWAAVERRPSLLVAMVVALAVGITVSVLLRRRHRAERDAWRRAWAERRRAKTGA